MCTYPILITHSHLDFFFFFLVAPTQAHPQTYSKIALPLAQNKHTRRPNTLSAATAFDVVAVARANQKHTHMHTSKREQQQQNGGGRARDFIVMSNNERNTPSPLLRLNFFFNFESPPWSFTISSAKTMQAKTISGCFVLLFSSSFCVLFLHANLLFFVDRYASFTFFYISRFFTKSLCNSLLFFKKRTTINSVFSSEGRKQRSICIVDTIEMEKFCQHTSTNPKNKRQRDEDAATRLAM